MLITISSNLTDEQAIILATEKGYNATINISPTATETEFVTNPQTPAEFLKNVYENMIKEDAKKLFIAYDDRLNIEAKLAREQELKDMVDAAFV